MNERNTLLYENISLSFYSRKGHTLSCNFKRLMKRHILREGTSSYPISSSWSQGVPTLAPPCKPFHQRRLNAFDRLRVLGLILDSDCLKISLCGSHITWFPSGYTPAQPAYPESPCLLITTWQLVKAHGVTRNEPKIHVNSHYITITILEIFSLSANKLMIVNRIIRAR